MIKGVQLWRLLLGRPASVSASCTGHTVRIACHTVPCTYAMQLWAGSQDIAAARPQLECMLQDHSGEAPLWSKACATVSSVNFWTGEDRLQAC